MVLAVAYLFGPYSFLKTFFLCSQLSQTDSKSTKMAVQTLTAAPRPFSKRKCKRLLR